MRSGRVLYGAPLGLFTSMPAFQGRRSFVACPWLSYFAPLALNVNSILNYLA
jgi:hypothetical protein